MKGRIKASSDLEKHQGWTDGPVELPRSSKEDCDR